MPITAAAIDRLKAQLLTSGVSQQNQALFQIINQLIDAVRQSLSGVESITGSGGGGGGLAAQSFFTENDDTATLPNSSQLLPGQAIEFRRPGNRTFIDAMVPFIIDGEDGEMGFIGPPGLQGPPGIPGTPGSGSSPLMPLFFLDYEQDESFPISLVADPNNIGYLNKENFWRAYNKFEANVDILGTLGVDTVNTLTLLANSGTITTLDVDNLAVTTGAIDLQSGQIEFPAVQHPSAAANVLDDYEEGTWTPTDASGAGLALTVTAARYVKIGQFVFASATFQYPATASGLAAIIGGLPFTVENVGNVHSGVVGFSNTNLALLITALSNTTTFQYFLNNGGGVTNNLLSGTTIVQSVMYRASA